MPQNQTKRLTLGAMIVALFTILLALSTFLPVASIVTVWFLALPIAWYAANYGFKASIFVSAVSVIVSTLLSGITALPLALMFAVIGLTIGVSLFNKKSKLALFMATSIAVLFTTALTYWVTIKFIGINVIQQSIELVRDSYEQVNKMTKSTTGEVAISEKQLEDMITLLNDTVPSLVIMSAFIITFVIIAVTLPVLRKLKVPVPRFAPFRNMMLPKSILWIYMIVLFISFIMKPDEGTYIYSAILNLSIILSMLLTLQAISFIHFVVHQMGGNKVVAWILTILSLPLSSFLPLVGILDLGFNIRAVISEKTKK